ncbi:MAG: TonB family protein [Acidobacteria bacterium]|nr:TonB family protein [Acidobacteriota bacterium]
MHITIRLPDPRQPGLPRMLAISMASHLLVGAMALYLPGLLPRAAPPRWDPVMIGSLVELPASAGGPPAPVAPAPAQAKPAPPRAEPAPPPPRPQPKKKSQPKPAAPKKKPAATQETAAPVQEPALQPAGTAAGSPGQADAAPTTGAAGPGQDNTGIGLRAGGGSFPHAYYLALVKNKLQANYAVPIHPGSDVEVLAVRITFRLSRDGSLSGVAVDIPSPYPPLDDAALRAVYRSAPFPGLPPAYTGETLELAVTFDLKPVGL